MKIFIYRHLLVPALQDFYIRVSQQHNFLHHYHWFTDILERMSAHETNDAETADYFFIPLFLLPFQFENVDISSAIESCPHLHKGRHILFASGDFGQRKKSATEGHHVGRAYAQIYSWLDDRFVLIALESTADLHPQDVAIFPYQIADEASCSLPIFNSAPRRRNLLYAFCGAMAYPQLPPTHIRGGALSAISGSGKDWFVGTPPQAVARYGATDGDGKAMFERSIFTLCPAGFGRWTFRWIESLLHGSIPVILSDGYILPFEETIDWREHVVVFPEKDLAALPEFLRLFPCGRVLQLQENILGARAQFTREACLNALLRKLESQCRWTAPTVALK